MGTVMKAIAETRWLSLFEKQLPDGKSWVFASRDGGAEHPKRPDAVIIVASHKDRLVITKEVRPIVGDYEYGFPAGLIDKDETAEQAAIREFKEETGLDLQINVVSPPHLYSSAGLTNETIQFVIGEASGEPSRDHLEPGENIDVILADIAFIREIAYSGKAMGAKAWPFFFMFSQIGHFGYTGKQNG